VLLNTESTTHIYSLSLHDALPIFEKLLTKLGDETDRSAQFVCVISMSAPGEETVQFKGTVQGEITLDKIGEYGFGYDPVFYVEDKNKTRTQLTAEEKGEIRRRGRAI